MSRASSKVEYRSTATISFGLKWLKVNLLSLGLKHPKIILLFCHS